MDDLEIDDHIEPSVFGEEDDDPFAIPPPLAPLPPPGEDTTDIQQQNGVLNLDGENEAAGEGDKEKTKTKKRAARPRVNLNEARLCSEKGIAAMKKICVDINFKGKGHEASDLNKLLQQFEHWAQCLMPSWPFENVVKRCEKLGPKRFVKNELHRLRQHEDEILRGESEGEADEGTGVGQTATNGEEPQQQETQVPQEETPVELTEGQMERIRKNRELAFARREALRQRNLQAEASQSETTTEVPETTQSPSGERNFNDLDENSNFTPGTDEDSTDTAMEAQRMNESPTEELHRDQPSESNQTADPVAELMDTNTNVQEEQPMQNNTPVEKHDTLNEENGTSDTVTDSIDQLDTRTKTDETSEIPTENTNLNETFEIEYPEEIADANPIESKEVVYVRPNNETNLVTDEKEIVEQAVADEIDQIAADAEEVTEVKTNDTRTTDNPDLENGEREIQDMVDDGTSSTVIIEEETSADLLKEDMEATHSTTACINEISDTTTDNTDQMVEMDTES